MKNVSEFTNFKNFYEKLHSNIKAHYNKEINDLYKRLNLKKKLKVFYSLMGVFIAIAVALLITVIVLYKKEGFSFVIVFLALAMFAFGGLAYLMFFFADKYKERFNITVAKMLNKRVIYKEAFALLDEQFSYDEEYPKQYRDTLNEVTVVELKKLIRPILFKLKADLETIGDEEKITLSPSHDAYFVNMDIKVEVQKNRNNSPVYKFLKTTLLKIDTKNLGDKGFAFAAAFENSKLIKEYNDLFKSFRLQKVKLESDTFNKTFNAYTNDEVKLRMMYTPLAMENMVKLHQNSKSVQKISNLVMISDGSAIYFVFTADMGFMEINWEKDYSNPDQLLRAIINDVALDIYNLYILISYAYIPYYLK